MTVGENSCLRLKEVSTRQPSATMPCFANLRRPRGLTIWISLMNVGAEAPSIAVGAGARMRLLERLEGDDGPSVLDARDGLHLLVDEMADVGAGLHVELGEQVEFARGRIDFGSDLGIGELVCDVIGFAELAFDLHEERDHACLRFGGSQPAAHRSRQSSKIARAWQGGLAPPSRPDYVMPAVARRELKCPSISASTPSSIPIAPAGTISSSSLGFLQP